MHKTEKVKTADQNDNGIDRHLQNLSKLVDAECAQCKSQTTQELIREIEKKFKRDFPDGSGYCIAISKSELERFKKDKGVE